LCVPDLFDCCGCEAADVIPLKEEEIPERDLLTDKDSWVKSEIGKKKILTLEFLNDANVGRV